MNNSETGEPSTSGLIPLPMMKTLDELTEAQRPSNEEDSGEPNAKMARIDPPESISIENRKIYIGNLPPSVTEKPLVAHFRTFGHVIDCHVVRDRETGISRGFAFLSFLDESEADTAVEFQSHKLDGKPIRVSMAQKNATPGFSNVNRNVNPANILDTVSIPRYQVRIYLGPLDDDVTNGDITNQLAQYGTIIGMILKFVMGERVFAATDLATKTRSFLDYLLVC